MNGSFLKFLGRWAGLMLVVTLCIRTVESDWNQGHSGRVSLALVFLTAIASGLTSAFASFGDRSWKRCVQEMENVVGALPGSQLDFVEQGPTELQRLTRAMRDMAFRVKQVVERANLESSRREAILSAMAEGVLAVDGDLRVVFCNDAFAQAFQARMPVDESRTLYEVVREPILRDILERVAKSSIAEGDRFQLPTAGSRWFEARALPLASSPGPGAMVVLHDVTDIQNQEQLRKDFVADVSHELRTPLAAIRGYAETLLDGALEDQANNRKFVEIIMSHAIRLNNIASDLLVLSELDSQSQPLSSPEPIAVREVVQSAIHSVKNSAAARSILLTTRSCDACLVKGVRFRLEQALVNLLDNAVKFSREGGEVVIECRVTEEGRVSITVTDSGLGIPSSDIKRIFERFYRVDKARTRPAGGTGLGLPIVKEVMERMGGSVSVESQLGRGSQFTLCLDAATPDHVKVLGQDNGEAALFKHL